MNISHNYSKIDDKVGVAGDSGNTVSIDEHTPKCVDEEILRDLISIPSPLFLTKPDGSE